MNWPDLTTTLIVTCLIATVSAYLAHRRGRNPYAWFFWGFFFGLLGIMAIFFAPQKREKKAPQPLKPQPIIIGPSDKFWYYLDSANQQMGPMSFDALNRAWRQGKVNTATFVWHEELPNWKPLHELIEELSPKKGRDSPTA